MLVTYADSLYPVGIAVTQWEINGKLRTFIMFPFKLLNVICVDIECAIEEEATLEIIEPQTRTWSKIKNGFGENAYGYPFNNKTADYLYKIWDEGAQKNLLISARVYNAFSGLVQYYSNAANLYLEKYTQEEYDKMQKVARSKGWDTSLIDIKHLTFPYLNHP